MAETTKERLNKQFAQLESERQSFEPHWRELSDYINPRGSRFLTSEVNRNDRRNTRIIDSTGTMAARTLASGMMSGITSPARPWFRLATPDPEMMDYGPVKLWLEAVQNRMNDMFNKSNLYQSLPQLYGSLGTYSTGAMAVLEDDEDIIRTMPFPIGSYYLANSPRGSVDTCFRKFSMTVRQLVQEFGLNNVSESVKSMWESGTYEKWIEVMHSVYPNIDRDTSKLDSKNKPFKSVYYEVGGDNDKLLRESGFDEFPIMAPRWEVNGEDVYGSSCPGMLALGPVKALQLLQKRKSQLIDKATNPPMVAPTSLKNQRASLLPGDITYIDQITGQDGSRPAYLVNPSTADLVADIQDTRQIINSAYFVDLFMMLQNINTRSMPVEAVIEMKEEKLRMEDALAATRAAVEEGIIAGGGSAYIHASKEVSKLAETLSGDERTGANVVLKALEAPLFHIAANAGLEGAVIINRVRESEPGTGFDAYKEEYVDMVKAGILDPAKVTRSALQNATSVASTLLTTESVVANIKEETPAMPAGAPGMGMM